MGHILSLPHGWDFLSSPQGRTGGSPAQGAGPGCRCILWPADTLPPKSEKWLLGWWLPTLHVAGDRLLGTSQWSLLAGF